MSLKVFKGLLVFLLMCSVAACGAPESPTDVYEAYNAKVVSGLDFNQEKEFFSTKKNAEIEQKIVQYMGQMNKGREEVIAFYMDFSRSVAKCKEIKLLDERTEGNSTFLLYEQKDVCGNSGDNERQSIYMVNEGGWKIDSVEIDL